MAQRRRSATAVQRNAIFHLESIQFIQGIFAILLFWLLLLLSQKCTYYFIHRSKNIQCNEHRRVYIFGYDAYRNNNKMKRSPKFKTTQRNFTMHSIFGMTSVFSLAILSKLIRFMCCSLNINNILLYGLCIYI